MSSAKKAAAVYLEEPDKDVDMDSDQEQYKQQDKYDFNTSRPELEIQR